MARLFCDDKEFGRIVVSFRHNMVNISFRWKPDGTLHINAPFAAAVNMGIIIDANRERIRAIRPAESSGRHYHIGQVIECWRFSISIGTQSVRPRGVVLRFGESGGSIDVWSGLDFTSLHVTRLITDSIGRILDRAAHSVLLPYARELAVELGVNVARFDVGRGLRRLGSCSPQKVILLSRNLLLYPQHLIQYVILHEFAHLTHLNHSAQFHALVNQYCGGMENELERELRAYKIPLIS